MSSLPMTPQQKIRADEPRTTPRKVSQKVRFPGNWGPNLYNEMVKFYSGH